MHDKLDEYNILKSEIVVEFKESYNKLLEEIRKYKFREDSSKGFAVKQNRNSQIILSDIQILNGIVTEILQLIDTYIKEHPDGYYTEKNIAYNSLKLYIKKLNDASIKLYNSMLEYYDDTRSKELKNSSKRARNWKQERNNALSVLLGVVSGLSIVGNMVKSQCQNNYKIYPTNNFQDFINYLATRPNYYSYKTLDEQHDITTIYKSIKQRKKQKH